MKQKNIIQIFHPYAPATINYIERWLSVMASDGWRLEKVHGWKFIFRKCNPYVARYFSYSGFGTSLGISNDFWASKHRYACNQSYLNKSNCEIFEVDIKRIDAGFNNLVLLRNKFYLKHYFALLLFATIYTSLAICVTLMNYILSVLLVFGSILLVYSLLSVVILFYEVKHRTRDG